MNSILHFLKSHGIVWNYMAELFVRRRALIIPEKRVLYVVSTMLTRIDVHVGPHKRRNWIFTHVGLICSCAQYCARD